MVLKCSKCDYTTNRSFNLKRHITTRHDSEQQENVTKQQVSVTGQQESVTKQQENVTMHVTWCGKNHECKLCGKEFTRHYGLVLHKENCKGPNPIQCEKCHMSFSNRTTLYRHRKANACQTLTVPERITTPRLDVPVVSHSSGHASDPPVTTNNVNIQLLVFPEDIDSEFDFSCDKVSKKFLQSCNNDRSYAAFGKFVGKVLENPVNRIIRKTNPNVDYSKVHRGNNEWELALDEDVFPIFTHHMTTAALGQLERYKGIRFFMERFRAYVDSINTDNESKEYKDAIKRIKLLVINQSRKWEKEAIESLSAAIR